MHAELRERGRQKSRKPSPDIGMVLGLGFLASLVSMTLTCAGLWVIDTGVSGENIKQVISIFFLIQTGSFLGLILCNRRKLLVRDRRG